MISTETALQSLLDQFVDTLRGLPEARAELEARKSAGTEPRYDARATLWLPERRITLLIELKKTLYPRDAQQVLWRLRDMSRTSPVEQEAIPVLVAELISPGAKDLLKTERVGFYDSGGSLFLPAKGVYIYVEKPLSKPLSKAMRSLFSGRRAQVLHALVMNRETWFGATDLAEKALVSPATASQVLTELEKYDWLTTQGHGPSKERRLREPSALLDTWVKQLALTKAAPMRRYYVPSTRPEILIEKAAKVFDTHNIEYAMTHEAAAQRYSPFLSSISQVRCRVLISPAAEDAIGMLGARAVSSGANLAILEAMSSGELLFRQHVDGVWLASPLQVYLDLIRSDGRAKEMAEHLRRERLGF